MLDGVSGRVLPSHDVGAWSAALVDLLDDPVRARAMGERGARLVEERFGRARARRTLRDALRLGADPVP